MGRRRDRPVELDPVRELGRVAGDDRLEVGARAAHAQQVIDMLAVARLVGAEEIVEGSVLADDDDAVLDRRLGRSRESRRENRRRRDGGCEAQRRETGVSLHRRLPSKRLESRSSAAAIGPPR